MGNRRYSVLALALLLVFCSVSVFAQEAEQVWKKINTLPAEEREHFVLSKAKIEGEVVWYTSLSADSLTPLKAEFEKRYPGVKLNLWRGAGERILNRILTEARAGKSNVDVMGTGIEHLSPIMKASLAGQYVSPERKFYPDILRDAHSYWTSYTYLVAAIAYNSNLVTSADVPKRYEDFLAPKWKGGFAIDSNSDLTVITWLKIWGLEKTEKFLQALVANEVSVRRGHTLTAQLLCAGEFKAAIELYVYRVADLKHNGCPTGLVFPDPTPGAPSLLYSARRSPRPYAASLLIDYVLSESGQRILAETGRHPARPGIRNKYPEMDMESQGVRIFFLRPEDSEQTTEKYLELRDRYLLAR